MAKQYKVKMTESQLEKFKVYLKEHKNKTKKRTFREAEEVMDIDDVYEDDKLEEEHTMTVDEMWEKLVDGGIATEEEVQLVTSINGNNEEAMTDILYARTGYRSFDQLEDYE